MNAKQKKIFDYLYFAYLIITTVNLFLLTTVFKYTDYKFLLDTIQFVLQFAIVAKVFLEWRTKWTNKDILLGIMTVGFFLIAACKFGNEDAFAYSFLILGAKDIDKKKILKVFLAVTTIMFAATVASCLLGFIPNATTYRSAESTHGRMALGFIYTTSLSAHFLSMVICLVMIRERKISVFEIILIGISSGIIYYITEARMATCAIALIFIGLVVAKICYVKKVELKLVRIPVVKYALVFSSSILMVISVLIGALYEYDNPFWTEINKLLSARPITNAITFHRYPLSLLGEHVTTHARIFDGMDELPEYYYIINCSYIGILFGIGVLGALAVLIVYTIISYKEARANQYMNLYVLAVMALFCFFEQRLFDFSFNPLLILLFSTYSDLDSEELLDVKSLSGFKYGNTIYRGVVTGIAIAFLIEMVGFNYQSVSTYLAEATTIDSAEVYNDGIFLNTDNDMFEYSKSDPMLILKNLKTYADVDSIFCDFLFMTKEDYYHYRLSDGVKYSVDYYSFIAEDEYEYLGTAEIDSSKRSTGYIPVSIAGPTQDIILQFSFPDDYYIEMCKLEFNGSKPFNISCIRIVIMWLIASVFMSVIYINRSKRSKDPGDSDNIEVLGEEIDESVD